MSRVEEAAKAMHATIVGGKPWDELKPCTKIAYYKMVAAAAGILIPLEADGSEGGEGDRLDDDEAPETFDPANPQSRLYDDEVVK